MLIEKNIDWLLIFYCSLVGGFFGLLNWKVKMWFIFYGISLGVK